MNSMIDSAKNNTQRKDHWVETKQESTNIFPYAGSLTMMISELIRHNDYRFIISPKNVTNLTVMFL